MIVCRGHTTHLILQSYKFSRTLLRNTLEQDASYLPNSSKPHHSSSYQRRTDPYPPVKGYCYLNSHTIQNMYPLPLISKLIDDMKAPHFSQILISDGATTTFTSEKRTSGKLPSLSSLWILQHPIHLSGIHELHLCQHANGEMAEDLYG